MLLPGAVVVAPEPDDAVVLEELDFELELQATRLKLATTSNPTTAE